jgi:TPR repeat protein
LNDESNLEVTLRDGASSLTLSSAKSRLIARGRGDAAVLMATVEAESESERNGSLGSEFFLTNKKSNDELRPEAENGDAKSQFILAFYYELYSWTGLHPDKAANSAEAFSWYRKAAGQGFAPAQYRLGWMHEVNPYTTVAGVVQDYAEAAKWYRKASDQGYAPAQFSLGTMYDKGEGVPQDYVEAINLYRKAADQGLYLAQFNLGLKYEKGQGVARDFTEATKWFRKAADQGDPSAQFSLGMKFNSAQGVPQDYVQAYMWMDLAASQAGEDDRKRYAAIRDRVAAKMNPTQIAEAQRLAAGWKSADQGKAWDFSCAVPTRVGAPV